MSRVLITGATGTLGPALAQALKERHEVIGLSLPDPDFSGGFELVACDLRDALHLHDLVGRIRPQVVIHAAALTAVDACETDPALAAAVNVTGTANLVDACPGSVELLCYVSTDFVFDGLRGDYRETDTPFPMNVYGCTKLAGERIVRSGRVPWSVLRTTFFGWGSGSRRSSVDAIVQDLQAGRPVKGWTNRFSTPLHAGDLADTVAAVVARRLEGLWHAGSDQRVSNYDLLQRLARILGLDPHLVRPAVWRPDTARALRPLDVSLDSRLLADRLGRRPGSLQEGLERLKTPGRSGGCRRSDEDGALRAPDTPNP